MKFIEKQNQTSGQVVPPPLQGLKSKAKRLLRLGCAALAVALAVGSVPFLRGFAAGNGGTVEPKPMNADLVDSGSCGASVNWTLDSDGVLTISGSGAMENRSYDSGHHGDVRRVIIEDGVTSIVGYAFSNYTTLSSVSIPSSVTTIGEYAFQYSHLNSVNIPEGVTTIGSYAFRKCTTLTSASIPSSITSFGDYIFADCSKLTTVDIADGLTSIGKGLFDTCRSLTTVTIPDSVTSIGDYALCYCRLPSITIPDSVTAIGKGAFGMSGLTSITLPDSVTSLGAEMFFGCSYLTSATLPKGLASIPDQLFSNCMVLKTLKIGYVTSVGSNAFSGSRGSTPLETVYYPCDHDVEGIKTSFPNSPAFVPFHTLTKTDASDPTCTDDGNIDYWTCSACNKIFSDEEGTNEIAEADTVVAALGHDFHDDDWATVTEATETTPGEEERFCHRDGCSERETREIPTRPDNYEFTADSGKTWTKGSTDGLLIVIKNTNGDDTQTFDKLVSVSVDGTALTRDTDYTAEPGSIKLTLSPDYLNTLDAGKHTLTVELTVTSVTYTFTVAAPASTDTPDTDSPITGESILLISVSLVLMLLAAGGAAYVLIRRRKTAE